MASIRTLTLTGAAVALLALTGCAGTQPAVTVTVEPTAPEASPTETAPEVEATETETPKPEETTPKPKKTTAKKTETAKPEETTEETPDPEPEPDGPTVTVYSQTCKSGKLVAVVKANYSNAYRKGIDDVVFERQNEYDAWLDYDGSWLGPETGQGNQWTGTINNLDGEKLRITVESEDDTTTVLNVDITANC